VTKEIPLSELRKESATCTQIYGTSMFNENDDGCTMLKFLHIYYIGITGQ